MSEDKKHKRGYDWEHNQALISAEYYKYLQKNNKLPTRKVLAEITGLSEKTIQRHQQEPTFKRNCESLRAVQDKMLAMFAKKVAKSNRKDMWELWFSVTEKEFVAKRVDLTTKDKKIESTVVTLNID